MNAPRSRVLAALIGTLGCTAYAEEGISFESKILATIPADIRAQAIHGGDYFAFAPNGRSVAYTAKTGDRWLVMVGEQKGEEFDCVGRPEFSPNGKVVAYTATTGTKKFVVVGNEKGKEYDDVADPCFSADGSTVAYVANKGGKIGQLGCFAGGQYFVVSGDQEGQAWDEVLGPDLSPDGKTVAYVASRGGNRVAVIGGRASEGFDVIYPIVFSPDGKTVAFAAKKGAKWFMVVGDKLSVPYDEIGFRYSFSPDGSRIVFAAKIGSKGQIVAGETTVLEVATDGRLNSPITSTDGKHVACALLERNEQSVWSYRMVLDGKKGEQFFNIGTAAMSPDGMILAYSARERNKVLMVVGEQRFEFESVSDMPVFSSDGKKIAFGARIGKELWWTVKDLK